MITEKAFRDIIEQELKTLSIKGSPWALVKINEFAKYLAKRLKEKEEAVDRAEKLLK